MRRRRVELTVDDIWLITDDGDQELRKLAHTVVGEVPLELGAEDNDGLIVPAGVKTSLTLQEMAALLLKDFKRRPVILPPRMFKAFIALGNWDQFQNLCVYRLGDTMGPR